MKGDDPAKQRRIVLGRRFGPAGDPGEDVLVGHLEKRLETGEPGLVEPVEMRVGEASEQDIDLLHAPVPGAELQPPPAEGLFIRRGRGSH